GVPFSTSFSCDTIPSTQTAAFLSSRNDLTKFTICRGILLRRSSANNLLWFTKSKNPFMSNVRAEVTKPWFHAACTSFVNVRIASVVEKPVLPPNCWLGIRSCSAAMCWSRRATIFSRTLPRHSSSVISRYALGFE
ncbi:hypothetical protein EV360DRAFT_35516, partial [Lentinula raphanica]